MKKMILVGLLAAVLGGSSVEAVDYLEGVWGGVWSPNSEWLAFNWLNQDDLFVISVNTGVSYWLKGVQTVPQEDSLVLSSEAPTRETIARSRLVVTKTVPSPGVGKLSLLGWAPDSRSLAYRLGQGGRAIFSVTEGRVTRQLKDEEPLPGQTSDELHLSFQLVPAAADQPTRFWIRVRRLNSSVLKEIAFDRPPEVRLVSAVRFRDVDFLSHTGRFLLYPRLGESGWQLLSEPVAGPGAARAVTPPAAEAPYEWKLTRDDRYVAMADHARLTVGDLNDWAHAQSIPSTNQTITATWSPDGKFLAFVDKRSLFLLERGRTEPVLVSDNCAPRFWGWRGDRLYFGSARTDRSNLFMVEPAHSPQPVELVKTPTWQSAPREVSVSPDGRRLVCLADEIDGSGFVRMNLCQFPLQRDAAWEEFERQWGSPDLMATNEPTRQASTTTRGTPGWVLYSIRQK